MHLPRHATRYLNERILFLIDNLGPRMNALPHANLIVEFANFLAPLKASPEQKVILCYLAALSRYPDANEIVKHSEFMVTLGAERVMESILGSRAMKLLCARGAYYAFQMPESSRTIIDITHTFSYPYISGIQRVVRKLCEYWIREKKPIQFIRFDRNLAPVLIDAHSLAIFRNPPKSAPPRFLAIRRAINMAKRSVKFLSQKSTRFQRFLESVATLMFLFAFLRERLTETPTATPVVFCWQNSLFLPEVAIEEGHAASLHTIFQHNPGGASMLLYDLIPITHPELCVVAPAFLGYAQLATYAKRITCISKSVERDLRAFLKTVDAQNQHSVKTASHYLGFDIAEGRVSISDSQMLPRICCLGTIEPRKNQIRVLRAALRLLKAGEKFELFFLGLPGWLSKQFIDELADATKAGFPIFLKNSLPDLELVEIMASARFTIFTTLSEGFGLPIVESLALGKPCITTNYGSTLEIAEKTGGCLTVDPYSVDAIQAAMKKMLYDQKFYEAKVAEAKKFRWPSWKDYAASLGKFIL